MSLIIWAPTSEGILVASDQPPFCVTNRISTLLAVGGDRPDREFGRRVEAYLQKFEMELSSRLHIDAMRTFLCQQLEEVGEGEFTVSLGRHKQGDMILLLFLVGMRNGRAVCSPAEMREYRGADETEFIPLGEAQQIFLSEVAPDLKHLKTLRQRKVKFVRDLQLRVAQKIAREMLADTRKTQASKGLRVSVGSDFHHLAVREGQPV